MDAELGARHAGLNEAAMVAAHQRDRFALGDAVTSESARQRVGAAVDVGKRERPELVDQGGRVRIPGSGAEIARRQRGTEAPQSQDRAQRAVGP